jgi:hypothetical protein
LKRSRVNWLAVVDETRAGIKRNFHFLLRAKWLNRKPVGNAIKTCHRSANQSDFLLGELWQIKQGVVSRGRSWSEFNGRRTGRGGRALGRRGAAQHGKESDDGSSHILNTDWMLLPFQSWLNARQPMGV